MFKVISENEDKVTRKTIKLYNDADDTSIVISEFYTEDSISVGNILKSDSFDFKPDPEVMQQIVEAVIEYKENGNRERE